MLCVITDELFDRVPCNIIVSIQSEEFPTGHIHIEDVGIYIGIRNEIC